MEMSDSWVPENKSDEDSSGSDDSISLLCDNNNTARCSSSGGAAGNTESGGGPCSQVGNKERTENTEMEMSPEQQPDTARCTRTAAVQIPFIDLSGQNGSAKNDNLLNRRDSKGETLLHRACRRKNLDRIQTLIQAGINVNTEDNAGWTALHEAAAVGNEAVVLLLLQAGADANARSNDGITPLHDAVGNEHHQVVKLLLQYGSQASHRDAGGCSALEMADDEDIREMLLTVKASPGVHERRPAAHRQPGSTRSEENVHSSASGDRARARERDTAADNISHSEAIAALLEEAGKKQAEISTWPLGGPNDAGRYHAALTLIQNMLIEALAKQRWEKNNLVKRYRSVPDYLVQRVWRGRLVSLASRQKKMVELLRKQKCLAEAYVAKKSNLSPEGSKHQASSVMRQQAEALSPPASTPTSAEDRQAQQSCNQDSPRKKGQTPDRPPASVAGAGPPPHSATALTVLMPLVKEVPRYRSIDPKTDLLQQVNSQMEGINVVIQTTTRDDSRAGPANSVKGMTQLVPPEKESNGHQSTALKAGNVLQTLEMEGLNGVVQAAAENNSIAGPPTNSAKDITPQLEPPEKESNGHQSTALKAGNVLQNLEMEGLNGVVQAAAENNSIAGPPTNSAKDITPQLEPPEKETNGHQRNMFQNLEMFGLSAVPAAAEDNSRDLAKLIQRGAVPIGSSLRVLLKGSWHVVRVLVNGLLKDNRCKVHLTPELWLESVLGNPVSAEYAWDTVTFKEQPLSYFWKLEFERPPPGEAADACSGVISQEELTKEAPGLKILRKIKIIHLVDDKELLPKALMDRYWERMLMADSEDWERY